MKKIVSMFLMVVLVLGMMSTTAFAANAEDNSPYGFTWYDDNAHVWHVQYYEYDSRAGAYRISDCVVIKDNLLYDMAGTLIVSDLAEFSEEKQTVVFDEDGLHFVSNAGETRYMSESINNTYKVSSFVSKYFTTDVEGLGEKAIGKNSSKKLSSLTFSGSYLRHTDPAVTNSMVKMYAVEGDPEKIGYDAYYNGNIIVTTYAKDSNVWVETVQRLLSDTCKGGKFVGYNGQYSVLLYDFTNLTVYEFWYKEGFLTAHPVVSNVIVYYFTKNAYGFINGIVTDKGTYGVDETINFPASQVPGNNGGNNTTPVGNVTEVKNFQSKSMAYDGATHLGTLSLKSKKLYWKGVEQANSYESSEFGVTASCRPVWINGNDDLYVNGQFIASNALRLKYDDNGRVMQYKSSDGVWHNID